MSAKKKKDVFNVGDNVWVRVKNHDIEDLNGEVTSIDDKAKTATVRRLDVDHKDIKLADLEHASPVEDQVANQE